MLVSLSFLVAAMKSRTLPVSHVQLMSRCARVGEKHEEEGAAERNCYGLPATSHAPSPAQGGGGKRAGGKNSSLNFFLCFLLSKSILMGNKLNQYSPSGVCVAFDGN